MKKKTIRVDVAAVAQELQLQGIPAFRRFVDAAVRLRDLREECSQAFVLAGTLPPSQSGHFSRMVETLGSREIPAAAAVVCQAGKEFTEEFQRKVKEAISGEILRALKAAGDTAEEQP